MHRRDLVSRQIGTILKVLATLEQWTIDHGAVLESQADLPGSPSLNVRLAAAMLRTCDQIEARARAG